MTLEEYEEMADNCVRCSKCKFIPQINIKSKRFSHICPSIELYNFHAYSGGGRMIIADALLKGRIRFTDEMLKVIYACTNCGGCEVSCKWVYELEPNEVIHELRVRAVEAGAGPMPQHRKYIESIEQNGNPYNEAREERLSWLTDEIRVNENSDTLYFVGCTSSYRRKEIALATAKILNAAGVEFNLLGAEEFCCGSPIYRVGAKEKAIEIMNQNIALFKELGVRRIITSCAGCFNMFHVEYPRYIDLDIEVVHSSQLLNSLLVDGKLTLTYPVPLKVTYHDPCHLGRMAEPYEPYEGEKVEILSQVFIWDPPRPERRGAEGVYEEPRNVLKMIPGVELVEMERIREYAYCCGAGGGVKAAFPELASWAATQRIEEAKATGAKAIVSTCPFCGTNFRDALKNNTVMLEYFDLVELVLRSLEGGG